jgi:hypothetical protein
MRPYSRISPGSLQDLLTRTSKKTLAKIFMPGILGESRKLVIQGPAREDLARSSYKNLLSHKSFHASALEVGSLSRSSCKDL